MLHTGLGYMNAILHVAPMVLNAARIEGADAFDFYGDGFTPSVTEVVRAMDDERAEVARALEVQVPTLLEWVEATYGVRGDDPYGVVQTLHRDVYGPLPAPTSLVHRYLTEDVPCGAVPVTDLARQLGVPAPVTAAGVTVADALLGTSWARTGRTMARLGLEGASAGEIHRRLLG